MMREELQILRILNFAEKSWERNTLTLQPPSKTFLAYRTRWGRMRKQNHSILVLLNFFNNSLERNTLMLQLPSTTVLTCTLRWVKHLLTISVLHIDAALEKCSFKFPADE